MWIRVYRKIMQTRNLFIEENDGFDQNETLEVAEKKRKFLHKKDYFRNTAIILMTTKILVTNKHPIEMVYTSCRLIMFLGVHQNQPEL